MQCGTGFFTLMQTVVFGRFIDVLIIGRLFVLSSFPRASQYFKKGKCLSDWQSAAGLTSWAIVLFSTPQTGADERCFAVKSLLGSGFFFLQAWWLCRFRTALFICSPYSCVWTEHVWGWQAHFYFLKIFTTLGKDMFTENWKAAGRKRKKPFFVDIPQPLAH